MAHLAQGPAQGPAQHTAQGPAQHATQGPAQGPQSGRTRQAAGGKFAAGVIIFLGLLTLVTPFWLFPVCTGTITTATGAVVPMKCFWTARIAASLGGAILFAGILLFFATRPGLRLGVALMLLPLGVVIILVPLYLVGVCPSEAMPCHMGTLPALVLLGSFVCLSAALIAWRNLAIAGASSTRTQGQAPGTRG